ncbi:hypothetical protein PUV47_18985, partial [Pseudovibrio exalbescens]|nr:hypothetical protein [Pseudovibrio exalbescens]
FADGTTLSSIEIREDGQLALHGIDDAENTILGLGLDDFLYGGNQADVLNGGLGDDYIFTGAGNDLIRFEGSDFGKDTISDFVAGAASEDVIEFSKDVLADYTELLSCAEDWGGENTYITIDADTSVTLSGVKVSDLHQDDFRFV